MNRKGSVLGILTLTLITGALMFKGTNQVNANAGVEHEYDLVELKRVKPGDNLLNSGDFTNQSAWTLKNSEIVDINGVKYGHLKADVIDSVVKQTIAVKKNTDYIVSFMGKRNQTSSSYGNVDIRVTGGSIIDGTHQLITGSEFQKHEIQFNSGDASSVDLEFVKWEDAGAPEDVLVTVRDTEIWFGDVSLKEKVDDGSVEDEKYNFVWAEDFNGNQLNKNNWGYELGHIRGLEQQHYVNDVKNVYVDNGKLTIKATDRALEDQYQITAGGETRQVIYDSGSIRTHGKQEFLYGRIEIKAKLPKGQAVFPAFWTLGSNFTLDGSIAADQGYGWPRCGEIDIMELTGDRNDGSYNNRTVYQTLHYGDTDNDDGVYAGNGTAYTLNNGNFNDDYHIFGLNWSEGKMEWYVDNQIVRTVDYSDDKLAKMALDKPQYVQLNLAMGGSWPGEVGTNLDGTTFDVDYVYYARNEQQQNAANEYYASVPQINGAKDMVMTIGSNPDLLAGITTATNYNIDFSIEDEHMFNNKGGNTKTHLLCKGKKDLDTIAKLKAGTYNLHYTAIPKNAVADSLNSNQLNRKADYMFNRKTVILKVVDVDKSELNKTIKQAEQLSKETSTYTSQTMNYLLKSLSWGQDISQDPLATQEYIDTAHDLLQDSIQKLRKKIIKE